ncbi:hypothetical protein EYF80_044771 [Liparis tanakae]|uniref:Uncharacterized protein n=1 Tax=Liparis tanakae TaxID=230148 RepID=A0A4Z2FWW6_9TELE|nr:hypothetical protein EYF80_044771 [Liparis tanakae]
MSCVLCCSVAFRTCWNSFSFCSSSSSSLRGQGRLLSPPHLLTSSPPHLLAEEAHDIVRIFLTGKFQAPQLHTQVMVRALRLLRRVGGVRRGDHGVGGVCRRRGVVRLRSQNGAELRLLFVHLVLLLRPLGLGRRAEVGLQLCGGVKRSCFCLLVKVRGGGASRLCVSTRWPRRLRLRTWDEDGDGRLHRSADDVVHRKHPVRLEMTLAWSSFSTLNRMARRSLSFFSRNRPPSLSSGEGGALRSSDTEPSFSEPGFFFFTKKTSCLESQSGLMEPGSLLLLPVASHCNCTGSATLWM